VAQRKDIVNTISGDARAALFRPAPLRRKDKPRQGGLAVPQLFPLFFWGEMEGKGRHTSHDRAAILAMISRADALSI
jgi:hypothetical protein